MEILLKNRNEFISGEKISTQLGVTRAAIWKYINALREEGYVIESSSKKGYIMKRTPEIFEAAVLKHGLNTKVFGQNMEIHSQIDSTNKRAKECAFDGAPEGMLILADEQTQGKGRLNRSWISPPGTGIWFSLILRPPIPPVDAPKITAMAGAAVVKAIERVTGLAAGIKWPNDIVLGGKKVCGILTEINADLDLIHYVVVGIGLNVNMRPEDFPDEIRPIATSLRIEKGTVVNRNQMIQAILESMEEIYLEYIKDRDFRRVLEICKSRSVILGKQVRVLGLNEEFRGTAVDLDDDGSLLVKKDDGQVCKVLSGDVSVRGVHSYV